MSGGGRFDDGDGVTEALRRYSREMLLLVDEDGTTVQSVRTGLPLLGYEPGDYDGRHVGQLVHPDDLSKVLDLLERGRRTPGLQATSSRTGPGYEEPKTLRPACTEVGSPTLHPGS